MDTPETNSDHAIDRLTQERFILEHEGLDQDGLLEFLATDIQELQIEGLKVVSIIGGAASGKSTIAEQIVNKLIGKNVTTDKIATDDFVVGDRAYRREHFEGADPLAKYDFSLMNKKIVDIRNAGIETSIGVPTYNEETGVAIAAGEENFTHRIGRVDVLIIEGDFNAVTRSDLIVYLHTPDEHRLQLRIDRDTLSRSEPDPAAIMDNFQARQQTQHFPHTLPAAEEAHVIIRVNPNEGDWNFDVYRRMDQK